MAPGITADAGGLAVAGLAGPARGADLAGRGPQLACGDPALGGLLSSCTPSIGADAVSRVATSASMTSPCEIQATGRTGHSLIDDLRDP
ncbi:MAG: hypothetical protein ACLPKE_15705 [Streptosporangiaceae bacterium]